MPGSSPASVTRAGLNCGPSQSVRRARVMPEALALPVSYHADGRASDTWT